MVATRAQLRERTGVALGLAPLNQALASQHDARLTTAYAEVYAQLKIDGLATWALTADTIPDEVVPYLVTLMCHNCIENAAYAVSPERYERIMLAAGVNGSVAKREIRKYTAPDFDGQDEPVDY